MLTPVTPNPLAQSTTIKSHGSETRTAPGHNPVEAQAVPQASGHSTAVGLDAGTILANVNAEAATAGNRTVLQTLALAVAAQLNMVRRNDETMEAFFLRIAAALDDMTPGEREATELQAGLKLLKIQLPALSAALKLPDSALAARLSAMAEAPLATPQKTAAAAATTSYLQEAPGVSRAAETLAMVTQVRTNVEGSGIFSSTAAVPLPEKQPGDARSLQTQLKSLFEPGVAETRIEIATKEEPANVLILGSTEDDLHEPVAASPADAAALPAEPARAETVPQIAATDDQPAKDPLVQMQTDAHPAEARSAVAEQPDADPVEAKRSQPKPETIPQDEAKLTEAKQADATLVEPKPADGKSTDARPAEARQPDARVPDMKPMDTRAAEVRQTETKLLPPSRAETSLPVSSRAEITAAATPDPHLPAPAERRPEPRMSVLPAPQNNNYPSVSAQLRAIAQSLVREKVENDVGLGSRRDDGDHRMQTMLTLKGLAEVITAMPSKAAEFLMSPQFVADIKAKEAKANTKPASAQAEAATRSDIAENLKSEPGIVRRDMATLRHSALPAARAEDAADKEARLVASHAGQESQPANAAEPGSTAIAKAVAGRLDPVPFAFTALQPAKEEFRAEAAEENGRREDEGEDGDEREREDPEARREHLARKATDDLLRPEPDADPELKITRDSSQADRAYALYQRMAGF
jgi:hypothetical protein